MKIVIASGKGGTGKTTIATNLAVYLKKQGKDVSLVDCDVEEPNAHLFFSSKSAMPDKMWEREIEQGVPVPQIDSKKCQGEDCLLCVKECRFKALIWMVNSVLVFPELCHGCGLCNYLCPTQAISESTRLIGKLRMGQANGLKITGGELRIGEAMAPPLIKRVKEAGADCEIEIIDAPPGTSCPVIETINEADFVLLVTEPTPFGLNDLKLAVQLVRKLDYPFGVAINRHGLGNQDLEDYLQKENIPVLVRLPHLQEAAQVYSKGELLVEKLPKFRELFTQLWSEILARTN